MRWDIAGVGGLPYFVAGHVEGKALVDDDARMLLEGTPGMHTIPTQRAKPGAALAAAPEGGAAQTARLAHRTFVVVDRDRGRRGRRGSRVWRRR